MAIPVVLFGAVGGLAVVIHSVSFRYEMQRIGSTSETEGETYTPLRQRRLVVAEHLGDRGGRDTVEQEHREEGGELHGCDGR